MNCHLCCRQPGRDDSGNKLDSLDANEAIVSSVTSLCVPTISFQTTLLPAIWNSAGMEACTRVQLRSKVPQGLQKIVLRMSAKQIRHKHRYFQITPRYIVENHSRKS